MQTLGIYRGIIFLFTALLLLIIAISSCKKKDETRTEEPTGSGNIEYMGSTYEINMGYYELYGEFEGIFNYQLYLFSDGIDIENETGSGNVIAIYFSTYSPPFPEGNIPYYSEFVDPYPTFEAEVVLDYDLDTETGIRLNYFDEGEITLKKSSDGKTFTVKFVCIQAEQDTLSGNYSGKLIEF